MNLLYVVPNLKKVSGGPRTRISLFKKEFEKNGGQTIEGNEKLKKSLSFKKIDLVYVESATNRISFIDLVCLCFLRLRSKKLIVFIRDIYIELFPKEYRGIRGKATFYSNKFSNFYLTLASTTMAFPTHEMGRVFFLKNKWFPKREYTDLPPGTYDIAENRKLPDFSKKLGILYLGSAEYVNSGFEIFLTFARAYSEVYHFFILSGDKNLSRIIGDAPVQQLKMPRNEIPAFIEQKNIAYAFHTRPRNIYDDLTYPIKVFDFISFQLPFFSERHIPLVKLLSNDYSMYTSIDDLRGIHDKIQATTKFDYSGYVQFLKKIALENTYEKRYKKLLGQ